MLRGLGPHPNPFCNCFGICASFIIDLLILGLEKYLLLFLIFYFNVFTSEH